MTVCGYCGQAEGHSSRCSVSKFGVAEIRWDGGDESRVQALMVENEGLRTAAAMYRERCDERGAEVERLRKVVAWFESEHGIDDDKVREFYALMGGKGGWS